MDYSIRPYSKADFLFLGTLSNDDEYKSQHLPIALSLQKADERTERCFVATVDNKIVGYIYGYIVPGRVTLPQFLYVKNENRRGGIGAALLKRFEDESQTPCSLIYYRKDLHDYYTRQGYEAGVTEVAMKHLPVDGGAE